MPSNLCIKYYLLQLHFLCHQSNKHPSYVDPLCMISLIFCHVFTLVSSPTNGLETKQSSLPITAWKKNILNNSVPLWVSYIFFHSHVLFCLKKMMQCVKCNIILPTPKVIRINMLFFRKSVFRPEKDISVWIRNFEKYFGGTGAGSFCSLGTHIRNSLVCFHYTLGAWM